MGTFADLFVVQSKARFDSDEEFKERSRLNVVKLQAGGQTLNTTQNIPSRSLLLEKYITKQILYAIFKHSSLLCCKSLKCLFFILFL